ncbi:MAG: hypothetical protein QXM43_07010 [Desulfurococcaceae archaeon]
MFSRVLTALNVFLRFISLLVVEKLLVTLGFRDPRQTVGRGLGEAAMTRPRRAYKNLERETV